MMCHKQPPQIHRHMCKHQATYNGHWHKDFYNETVKYVQQILEQMAKFVDSVVVE